MEFYFDITFNTYALIILRYSLAIHVLVKDRFEENPIQIKSMKKQRNSSRLVSPGSRGIMKKMKEDKGVMVSEVDLT